MNSPNKDIDHLIQLMAKLPGFGPRSARRAVLHLVKKRDVLLAPLADSLLNVASRVGECAVCGNLSTADKCDICTDPRRANGQICVIEDVSDLWAMERSNMYRGAYHILGGVLSALDHIGPEELRIPLLLERVQGGITEVILALNATIDGQTTAHYIADQLQESGLLITTLAQGIPIGGELDYLDDGTINEAFRARRSL